MDVKVIDIIKIMNAIAPPALAEENDNVGLQCGHPDQAVEKIRVALDPTIQVIREAIKDGVGIIVTHHPLLFRPLQRVDFSENTGVIIKLLAENNMSLFCAHTNLDSAEGGINDMLSGKLGLNDTAVLGKPYSNDVYKFVVFVPVAYSQKILDALYKTEAGRFANYSCCTFSSEGTGTFRPEEGAKPFSGTVNEVSEEKETRIETIVLKRHLSETIKRVKDIHPYETMAYDVYPLATEMGTQGLGRVGTLERETRLGELASVIKKKLGLSSLRVAGDPGMTVKKVAVCSGSGSSLLNAFLSSGAQAYVSGDLKYHDAKIAEESGRGLIDIGHVESEHIIVPSLCEKIRTELEQRSLSAEVDVCRSEKDPFMIMA